MLIGYSMPAVSAIALGAGASSGQAWLTSDDGAACFDGKPARKARLQWAADAVPDVGHYVQVSATFAAPAVVRICALLGLTGVPEGAEVAVYGKRVIDGAVNWDFGGDNNATVVQFADGTYGAWFVLPGAGTAVEAVAWRLYNDVDGATWADAATQVDVGELVAMPAVEIAIDRDWSNPQAGTTTRVERGRSSQVSSVAGVDFRRLSVPVDAAPVAQVRGAGLDNGMDWQRLQRAFSGGARVVAIPRWVTPAGELDIAEINATALYGVVAGQGEIAHLGGDYYRWSLAFDEVPAT